MKAFARCVILVATVVAPLELRAELFNQKVTFGHASTIWLPNVGDSPGLRVEDRFFDEIGVGEEMAGQTSVSIDEPYGRFEASSVSSINFGTPGTAFWYGTYSGDASASNALTSNTMSTRANFFNYSFNATEPGTLFVRLFFDDESPKGAATVQFKKPTAWSELTYAHSNGSIPFPRTIDVEYQYTGQSFRIDNEGRTLFTSSPYVLEIKLPSINWAIGSGSIARSHYAAFNWGHQAFPGSSPAIPEMPSALLTMIPMGLFFFARLRAKRLIAG